MADCKEFFYLSADGKTNIHALMWLPEEPPRAILQISHGICEYVERYADFARFLTENGYLVVGNDHLGHGRSWQDPERQGLFAEENGWQYAVDDVEALRARVHGEYPDLPYFLLGHSMGSFIARTYLIRYPSRVDGALICGTGQQPAPLLKLGVAVTSLLKKLKGPGHRSKLVQAMMFGGYNRDFRPVQTPYDWLTADRDIVEKYAADPGCTFLPTVSLYRDMLKGILFISDPKNLEQLDKTTPVFVFSGAKDPVGERGKGVQRAWMGFEAAGCIDVQHKLYADGRHEVLNETFREQVYVDVLHWMEVRAAGLHYEG